MDQETSARDYTVPAAERVVLILRHLRDNHACGVSQIAAALSIGRGPCYAILKTLQQYNFVRFNESDKTYQLGMGVLELSRAVAQEDPVRAAVRAFLPSYVARTLLSTFLVARYGEDRVIVLDAEEPAVDIRLTISVGTTTPLTLGASGKCLMAFMEKAEQDRIIEAAPLPVGTGDKRPSKKQFRETLRTIRETGYAIVFDEAIHGANSIAAPIFDQHGQVAFVLTSVAFTRHLSGTNAEQVARQLRAAALDITRNAGGSFPS